MYTSTGKVADDIWRCSTRAQHLRPVGFTFNQLLGDAEAPLLFHARMRSAFGPAARWWPRHGRRVVHGDGAMALHTRADACDANGVITTMTSDYVLTLTDSELQRYQLMAERARDDEAELWAKAGIAQGSVVIDVGCSPAATAVAMAQVVGQAGRVIGVERDPGALQCAQQLIDRTSVTNLELRAGDATATGVQPGIADVAVMRHVLAHNGGREQEIVDHLATLVRPGAWVFLVDVDLTAQRMWPGVPHLADLGRRPPP